MHRRVVAEELVRRAEIVAREFGGLLPHFEAMYLRSILYAAGRSLDAFRRFRKLKDPRTDPEQAVSLVQEAVGHAAAVSRCFWPVRAIRDKVSAFHSARMLRGKKLRVAFAISDRSPLANRNLRNTWEHFDEKLDQYLLHIDSGILLPGCLIESHQIADDAAGYTFKVLDPEAECLVLLGERFFYGPIRDEVKRVHQVALEKDRSGGRL